MGSFQGLGAGSFAFLVGGMIYWSGKTRSMSLEWRFESIIERIDYFKLPKYI